MGCGCNERRQTMAASAGPTRWIVTQSDGSVQEFGNYDEAFASASATGGRVTPG